MSKILSKILLKVQDFVQDFVESAHAGRQICRQSGISARSSIIASTIFSMVVGIFRQIQNDRFNKIFDGGLFDDEGGRDSGLI